MHRPSDALRLTLLAALGAPACTTTVVGSGDTDDVPDTGQTDSADTSGPVDTADSGGPDTAEPPDTGDSGTTDTGDTGVVQVGETDTADTGAICTGGFANAEDQWDQNGWLGFGEWTLCLDASIPYGDPACTASADLAGRLDEIMSPDCEYSDTDTGFFPIPINSPCDDGTTFFDAMTCGPFPDATGACCFEVMLSQVAIGRPLVLDGAVRTAVPVAGSGWLDRSIDLSVPDHARDAVRTGWLEVARAEHASVASFARVVLDLLTHGAPADLVRQATEAQADEIRHAELAFALASGLDDRTWGPGPLDLTGLSPRTTLPEVVVAAIVEGCVGETVAAHEAAVAARHAESPALAAALQALADDEARHAALAWRLVDWALGLDPSLADLVARTFDEAAAAVRSRLATPGPDLARWGLLTGMRRVAAAHEALDAVVTPCRAHLAAA